MQKGKKYEDKIYFLDDILDELEKDGVNREIAVAIYNHFREELIRDVGKTDNVAYKLGSLGTLYFTIKSLKGLNIRATKQYHKGKNSGNDKMKQGAIDKMNLIKAKRKKITKLITRAKEHNNLKILFFRTRFNPRAIKNT
jgi:hypothetical protein